MFLAVRNLSKSYRTGITTPVLKNVELDLRSGQIGVVLGPSGSGKSTLMNVIGGIDRADEGTVDVDGVRVTDLGEKQLVEYRRARLGYVFQFYNLVPNLTAAENVEVVARIARDPHRVEDVLAAVGLPDKRNSFPRELSGGEQQRVAIARALVKNPRLLLCDEPTGALDLDTGRSVLRLLHEVNVRFGTTILMITHNLAISGMADVVIRLRSGAVADVVHNPARVPVERVEW